MFVYKAPRSTDTGYGCCQGRAEKQAIEDWTKEQSVLGMAKAKQLIDQAPSPGESGSQNEMVQTGRQADMRVNQQ